MGAFLGMLFEFLSGLFGRLFSVEVAKFLAYKVLLKIIVFTGLVIVYQLILGLTLDWVLQLLQSEMGNQNVVLSVAGLGAWILIQLRFPECMTLILSALSVRVALRLLPVSPAR